MKIFKISDPNAPIMHFNTNQPVDVPNQYIEKPLRGLWVSTVLNIDLPIL